MNGFSGSIVTEFKTNKYKDGLVKYCLEWDKHHSEYAIKYVIDHLVEQNDRINLFNVLTNIKFRQLKKQKLGINVLLADLQKGLSFFMKNPDLIRYIQLLFLEQHITPSNITFYAKHQKYCKEYSNFLQLNVPIATRKKIGIHYVVNHMFPISNKDNSIIIKLIDYELGVWRCKCGTTKGLDKRSYNPCPSCGTKVSLDLFWYLQEGRLHPSELKIPLILTLLIEQQNKPNIKLRFAVMDIPLMLGLYERDGNIFFEPPDIFWLEPNRTFVNVDGFIQKENLNQFFLINDLVFQKSKDGLRKLLEESAESVIRKAIDLNFRSVNLDYAIQNDSQLYPQIIENYDMSIFIDRLVHNKIVVNPKRSYDFDSMVDISRECTTALSSELKHNMVYVNHNLARSGEFSVAGIVNYDVILKKLPQGIEKLTPVPLGQPRSSILDADGIVRPGSTVNPGDILVGIESPISRNKKSTEEKLLYSILGGPKKKNSSLVYKNLNRGHVLAVSIIKSKNLNGYNFGETDGKCVKTDNGNILGDTEMLKTTISIAIEQPIAVGDIIYADNNTKTVVCKIVDDQTLTKLSKKDKIPDLIVSPRHPWVQTRHNFSIKTHIKSQMLAGQEVWGRSTGNVSAIESKPMISDRDHNPAQLLITQDFEWLLAQNSFNVAFELFGPHCNYNSLKLKMLRCLSKQNFSLKNQLVQPRKTNIDLSELPNETIKHFFFLLRGLGIKVTYINKPIPLLNFSLITNKERQMNSWGEITNAITMNNKTFIPAPGGLFCEKIFGAISERPVRGHRTAIVSLPINIIHPLYLKRMCNLLAENLHIDSSILKDIAFSSKYVKFEKVDNSKIVFNFVKNTRLTTSSEKHAFFQGVNAIRKILERFKNNDYAGRILNQFDNLIMNSIEVIPPAWRPPINLGGWQNVSPDINGLYQQLIVKSKRVSSLINLQSPQKLLNHEFAMLRMAVENLFNNACSTKPLIDKSGHPINSLVDSVLNLCQGQSNLLDGLLQRPVDFSGQTRLVVAKTKNINNVFLPYRLAVDMIQPFISSVYNNYKSGTINDTDLDNFYKRTIILISPDAAPWRLIAVYPQVYKEMSLAIHPDLMDILGWNKLGERVKVFLIFSKEAKTDAERNLLPSKLYKNSSNKSRISKILSEKKNSVFYINENNLIDTLLERALNKESFSLSLFDKLILVNNTIKRR